MLDFFFLTSSVMDLDFTLAHGPKGSALTQNAYFSLLTLTKKLLLVTFSDQTAETEVSFWTHGWTDIQNEMERWTDCVSSRIEFDFNSNGH